MEAPQSPDQLVAALLAGPDPVATLPEQLPCTPLDLLVAMHQEVLRTMLSDLNRAARAAAAAWLVVQRFPDDMLLRAQAHWTQGNAILYVPEYALALEHYDAALAYYAQACRQLAPLQPARDVRVVYNMRIFCLSELGRYQEALQAVEQADRWLQENPDDNLRLTFLQNSSFLIGSMGDYGRMLEMTDAMIELATRIAIPARIAQGWINRAYACIYLGRFAEAGSALERGIAAAQLADEPITVARAHWNRARLLRCQGKLFAALQQLKTAEHGLAQAHGEAATLALEAAAIYERLYQFPEAQQSARFAAEQFAQQAMPTYSASAALQAARIALQRGQVRRARQFIKQARAGSRPEQSILLHAEALVVEARLNSLPAAEVDPRTLAHRRRQACQLARQAVDQLQAGGLSQAASEGRLSIARLESQLHNYETAITMYQSLAEHDDPQIRMQAHAGLASLLQPAEALPHLQQAANLAVEQRRLLPVEELQARYSSETSPHHSQLAACHLALDNVDAAVEAIFAAKVGPFLDLRALSGNFSDKDRSTIEFAKAELARCREQIREHQQRAADGSRQNQYEQAAYHARRSEELSRELAQQEQNLTEQVRLLGGRHGRGEMPDLAAVQATLPEGTVVLEYACIDAELVGFQIQADQRPRYCRLGPYRQLAALLERWDLLRQHLLTTAANLDAAGKIREVLLPLSTILLDPWQDTIAAANQLLIAPWDILHHVPWAALPFDAHELGSLIPVTVTLSSALQATAPPSAPDQVGPPRLLGYAGQGNRHLSNVATELAAIARHVPNAQIISPAGSNDLRSLPPPRLLHIAAHAESNSAAPVCSSIELADGLFLLLEAHRQDLRGTELVVLSACETSVRPEHGDMALALAGAFLCAGANAVMASLWPVDDAATALLMELFYANLGRGAAPDQALQRSQQLMRSAYPLDWAAFQIWAASQATENLLRPV